MVKLMGEVIQFPTAIQKPNLAELSENVVKNVVDFYWMNGADDEYCAMLGKYLTDTEVLVINDVKRKYITLEVQKNSEQVWKRKLFLPQQQVTVYEHRLSRLISSQYPSLSSERFSNLGEGATDVHNSEATISKFHNSDSQRRQLAANWVFFEATADIFSEVYSMQRRFNRYIPDYGGGYEHTELSVVEDFFKKFADLSSQSPQMQTNSVLHYHNSYKTGIALQQLKNELLRRRVTDTLKTAEWMIQSLMIDYPRYGNTSAVTNPLSGVDIKQRISQLKPRGGMINYFAELRLNPNENNV